MSKWVATYAGVPPASMFGITRGQGTPIIIDTTTGKAYYLSATGVVTEVAPDPWTYVQLASDFTINTTANNNVTGLAFAPQSDTSYEVEGRFFLQTSVTTTGPRPGIAWPSGFYDGAGHTFAPNSATANALQNHSAAVATANAASTGLPAINRSYMSFMSAVMLVTGAMSGNFQITLASETAAVNVTMKAGSFIRYRAIP